MAGDDRPKLVYMARLCEEAERYDDMRKHVRALAELGESLSLEERNLLSVAYKASTSPRRAAWRVLAAIGEKEAERGSPRAGDVVEYRQELEREIVALVVELVELVEKEILPKEHDEEARVFYLKLLGDYHRYAAEVSRGEAREAAAAAAEKRYQDATAAASTMVPTHPMRLSLALNHAVFRHEIANKPGEAWDIAKAAFDAAAAQLDTLGDEQYKDATAVLQLLRDNLALWTDTEERVADAS